MSTVSFVPPIHDVGPDRSHEFYGQQQMEELLESIIQQQRRQLINNERCLSQLLDWKGHYFPSEDCNRSGTAAVDYADIRSGTCKKHDDTLMINETSIGTNKALGINTLARDANIQKLIDLHQNLGLLRSSFAHESTQSTQSTQSNEAEIQRTTPSRDLRMSTQERHRREFEFLLNRPTKLAWLQPLRQALGFGLHNGHDALVGIDEWRHRSLHYKSPWVRKLAVIIHSKAFVFGIVLTISANAFFTAYEESLITKNAFQYHQQRLDRPVQSFALSQAAGWFFFVVFGLELIARVVVEGIHFLIGKDYVWNLMDTFLVLSALVENTVYSFTHFKMSFMRVLRLLRALRGLKFLRVLRFFKEVRLMLVSIINCLWPLMWFLLFLFLIIFVFGLIFLQACSEYLLLAQTEGRYLDNSDTTFVGLEQYFNTVGQTMFTLFIVITGGEDWYAIQQVIMDSSKVYGFVFVFYIATVHLCVLNIITGIFVETTFSLAQMDRTIVTQNEMEKNMRLMEGLRELFDEIDDDQSGTITWGEFEKHVTGPEVSAYMRALDLEATQVEGLFKLLDANREGYVDIDDFVMGCLRLKGCAKTVDIATVMFEQKKMQSTIVGLLRCICSHCMLFENRLLEGQTDPCMENRVLEGVTDPSIKSPESEDVRAI